MLLLFVFARGIIYITLKRLFALQAAIKVSEQTIGAANFGKQRCILRVLLADLRSDIEQVGIIFLFELFKSFADINDFYCEEEENKYACNADD